MARSESGSRCSEVKLRWPAPQLGLRSISSGRASVITIRGWLRDHSRIDSTKSMSPGSAHCRSSKTMTVGPRNEIPSKNARQAEKSSSRSPAGDSTSPRRWASRGSIHLRSSGSETNSATEAASLALDEAASSDSLMAARILTISPSAQNVMPSP